MTTKEEKGSFSERRDRPRHRVNLPASVKITTSEMTQPFDIKEATICDVNEGGFGLSLTVETVTTRNELSRLIVRRRACYATTVFPGAQRPSHLYGDIIWVEPHATPSGTVIRFGISIDRKDPEGMADLRAFLKTAGTRGPTKADFST